jgi:hypothetical protein
MIPRVVSWIDRGFYFYSNYRLGGWVYMWWKLWAVHEKPFQGMNDIPMLSLCRVVEIDLLGKCWEKLTCRRALNL